MTQLLILFIHNIKLKMNVALHYLMSKYNLINVCVSSDFIVAKSAELRTGDLDVAGLRPPASTLYYW